MTARIIFVAMFGIAAASVGCSGSSSSPAADSADFTAKGSEKETPAPSKDATERLEYVCELPEGRIVEVHSSFAELHRIDLNKGTWEMEDGLSIETAASRVTIKDDEGGTVATIDEHLQFTEGTTKGTCKLFGLKELQPTASPFNLDDTLEYSCRVNGGVELVVRPKFGEIDEISVEDGKFASYDGISFSALALESLPPKTKIDGVDEEGTSVASIVEDDRGATITMGDLTGSCKKFQRAKR